MTLAIIAMLALLAICAAARAQDAKETELNRFYPCATHLPLEDKERLNDYANATKSDPCSLTANREELNALVGSLGIGSAGPERGNPGIGTRAPAQSPLQSLANQQKAILSSLQCQALASVIMGLPSIIGQDEITRFSVSLDTSGRFLINGRRIPPIDIVEDGSSLSFAMIRLQDFLSALSSIDSSTGSTMGLNNEESKALSAVIEGFVNLGVGNRERFVIFDTSNSQVVFADADGNNLKNLRQADCLAQNARGSF